MAHLHSSCVTLVYEVAPYPHDVESLQRTFQSCAVLPDAGADAGPSAPSGGLTGFFATAAGVASQIKATVDKKVQQSMLSRELEAFMENFYSHSAGLGGQLLCGTRCKVVSAGVLVPVQLFLSSQAVCLMQTAEASGSTRLTDRLKEVIALDDIVSLLPSVSLPVADKSPPVVIGVPSSTVVPNALQIYTGLPLRQIFQLVFNEGGILGDSSVTFQPHAKTLPEATCAALSRINSRFSGVKVCCAVHHAWMARRLCASRGDSLRAATATPPSPSAADVCSDRPEAEEVKLSYAPAHF
jgi:hypothetical protein